MMKRWTLIVVSLALSAGLLAAVPASAAPLGKPRPTSYILPGDQVFPEGVAYQSSTGNFYVSSTTDGTIFRGNVKQAMTTVFLPGGADGRTTATGLKVDHQGRLFVSGGSSGKLFIYDTTTGKLLASFSSNATPTFINDVAVAPDGSAYFTDSLSPFLYRVVPNPSGGFTFETWLDFTGTALVYQTGFNVNGIAATHDGKYLIVVQSNTGKLFRINTQTKAVAEIALEGEPVTAGDGLLLRGHTLYVVRNSLALIVKIKLAGNFSSGQVVSSTTDPSFAFPTTIAEAPGRFLVVNSQFDKRGPPPTPVLPFTVSSVHIP
ncbi:MAG: SMP-30/gluconolactonase/LRE family protein [Roseiflexaceae bacterium]